MNPRVHRPDAPGTGACRPGVTRTASSRSVPMSAYACSTWSTVEVAKDDGDFKAQWALSRAVESERTAIDTHEAAPRRLDQLAAEMEQDALRDRDEQQQNKH
jgi:hypothetical protein